MADLIASDGEEAARHAPLIERRSSCWPPTRTARTHPGVATRQGIASSMKSRQTFCSGRTASSRHRQGLLGRGVLAGLPGSAPFGDHRHPATQRGGRPAAEPSGLPSTTSANWPTGFRPPQQRWTPDIIWDAVASGPRYAAYALNPCTLTDLVSLIRYAVGADDRLVPYADGAREVRRLAGPAGTGLGTSFTQQERWWLDRIADVIASSAGMETSA